MGILYYIILFSIKILNEYDDLIRKALEIILLNKQYKPIITESSESEDVSFPTSKKKLINQNLDE